MHAVDLIAASLPESEKTPPGTTVHEGTCCLTGEQGPCVQRRDVIAKSFCDQAALAAPESNDIGLAGWTALKYKWERMSCWLCDGVEFQRLKGKPLIRGLVLNGPQAERWVGYITTSYKKHGAIHAPVNSNGSNIWRFEMLTVDCSDRVKNHAWFDVLCSMQRDGLSRASFETLTLNRFEMQRLGVKRWLAFCNWAEPRVNTPLYKLLVYCLPTMEEFKK
jgi:hypothetical protein